MEYTLTGKIKKIKDMETHGTFSKREFIVVVDPEGKWPQEVPLEFTGDKIGLLDALSVGQTVTVSFNLRGNEWKGHDKWFVSLQAWKVVASDGAEYVPAEENKPTPPADKDVPADFDEYEDDIPFNDA